MSAAKPLVIFVLGGPGVGKGTQCGKIVEKYGFIHLSAGDLLRKEKASGSKDGDMIEHCLREGKIVPVEVTINLLQKEMDSSAVKKFLIDGFPRNEDNLEGWEKRMNGKADVKMVLFFDCSEEVCLQRLKVRGETSGRSDDNLESIRKRFQTYQLQTLPILRKYEAQGLVRRIDASPQPDVVFAEVSKLFDAL